jgi:hypothetical protein
MSNHLFGKRTKRTMNDTMEQISKRFFSLVLVLLLAMTCRINAQTDIATHLTGQLTKYSQQHFQEKIFVHTDKSFYVCGEIIWFKLYNTDAYLNRPAAISKVAYVELLSADHKQVLQAKIELQQGKGNGSFMLPFSLNSGTYIFRAYTNWMKNFSPDLFFEKPINIVNTLKKTGVAPNNTGMFDIQFFPEGGNLVSGLQSKLAFHAVGQNGKGVTCSGVVVDQNKDTIVSFLPRQFGMGYFYFTPQQGNTYKALVQSGNKTIERDLPNAYESGYVMKLVSRDEETIQVSVQSRGHESESIFLLTHTRQMVKQAQSKTLSGGQAEFIINKKELGEGISHFTLFNSQRQPVCERLYFRQPVQSLNVGLTTNEQAYALRRKVDINISSSTSNQPIDANLSLAVFRVDSLQAVDQDDIQSYLWLGSELRGKVESPYYYFTTNNPAVEEAADNLMLTQGWSRFKWENVLNDTKPVFHFLPEYEGLIVAGTIREKKSGLSAGNVKSYLSIPGERFVFNTAASDRDGTVFFNTDKFYGSADIILQAQNKPGESYSIEIASPFASNFSSRSYPSLTMLSAWQNELTSYSVSTQVENSYVRDKKLVFYLPESTDTTAFYGKPDKTYVLDDYTRFITMEEVMREYVTEVRVRKQQENFNFKVKNEPLNVYFENDPLVLLDGLPVMDISKLMQFDPLKVKRLDLVTRKYFAGKDVIEGIVSFSTYKGNLDGFQLNPDALVVEYPGLQLQREFYSPVYETQEQLQSPLPDFRNLLYWAPDIKTGKGNSKVEFYTSDRPGKYAAVVQGISSNGIAGSKIVYFTVSK